MKVLFVVFSSLVALHFGLTIGDMVVSAAGPAWFDPSTAENNRIFFGLAALGIVYVGAFTRINNEIMARRLPRGGLFIAILEPNFKPNFWFTPPLYLWLGLADAAISREWGFGVFAGLALLTYYIARSQQARAI